MAITISFTGSQRVSGQIQDSYRWTAANSGDTLSLTVSGALLSIDFYDANGNAISSNPPTMGTVSAGTIPGTNTGTITANAGGVVTNGAMVVVHGGM